MSVSELRGDAAKPSGPLRLIDIESLAPAGRWIVSGVVPAGMVAVLSGFWPQSNTALALHLAVARAVGQPWLGWNVPLGDTLVVTNSRHHEDTARTLNALCSHYGVPWSKVDNRVRVAHLEDQDPADDDTVPPPLVDIDADGMVHPTALFERMRQTIEACQPDLVILDTVDNEVFDTVAAETFGFTDVSPEQIDQFADLLQSITAQSGCSFLVVSSVPKSSEAWIKSTRHEATLLATERLATSGPESLRLTVINHAIGNYCFRAPSERSRLEWNDGIFVVAEPKPEATPGAPR